MEQYISKSALVAEIENLENRYNKCPTRNSYEEGLKDGRLIGYKDALHKINTLEVKEYSEEYNGFLSKELKMVDDEIARLEKLKVKEVDLEKEVNNYGYHYDYVSLADRKELVDFAKHFFELGLNASNPIGEVDLESLVRQVNDLYLEAGKHYDSVIKEERKKYGGSDLAINLLSGTIDAKELCIQYVLDKLKAQKG